ncbi:MAG TPA: fibronectin type III domain-containing protein [Thermodesulfobacteriota bacterium]|nr:fibronectin type III domain-containing protein [Thermodesulfobacteriota bacterium]
MPRFQRFLLLSLTFLLLVPVGCGGGGGGEVSARANSQGEITLAWDSRGDEPVAGYRIYYGTASKGAAGKYEHFLDIGMATQVVPGTTAYTLKGLIGGQIYYLAVTVYSPSNAESGYSNEVSGIAR